MQRFVAFAASAGIVLATETATASAVRQALAPHTVTAVQRADGQRAGGATTSRRREGQSRKLSAVQQRLLRDVVLADAVRQRLPLGTSVIDVRPVSPTSGNSWRPSMPRTHSGFHARAAGDGWRSTGCAAACAPGYPPWQRLPVGRDPRRGRSGINRGP